MSTSARSRTSRWLLAGALVLGLSIGFCADLTQPALALPIAAGATEADCVGHASSQPCAQVCEPTPSVSPKPAALVPPAFVPVPPAQEQYSVAASPDSKVLPPASPAPSPPLYVLFLKLLL